MPLTDDQIAAERVRFDKYANKSLPDNITRSVDRELAWRTWLAALGDTETVVSSVDRSKKRKAASK